MWCISMGVHDRIPYWYRTHRHHTASMAVETDPHTTSPSTIVACSSVPVHCATATFESCLLGKEPGTSTKGPLPKCSTLELQRALPVHQRSLNNPGAHTGMCETTLVASHTTRQFIWTVPVHRGFQRDWRKAPVRGQRHVILECLFQES